MSTVAKQLVTEFDFGAKTTAADVSYFARTSAVHYFSPLVCKIIEKHAAYIAGKVQDVHAQFQAHKDEMQIAWMCWGD